MLGYLHGAIYSDVHILFPYILIDALSSVICGIYNLSLVIGDTIQQFEKEDYMDIHVYTLPVSHD